MITLQVPPRAQAMWKVVVAADADDDDSHQWIVAELQRGSMSYPIDSMRRPDGEVIDIIEVVDDEAPALLKAFEEFKLKWMLYALELGLPFEVDKDIQEWLDELTQQDTALTPNLTS
jgi:hypothetical protein